MAWLTTDDGRHLNTEMFDADERKKYAQFEKAQKEAEKAKRGETGDTAKSFYEPQKFKLVHSAYGNKTYESELFEIHSYSRNSSHTSWKESGYTLQIKKRPSTRQQFDTLKQAKQWLDTDDAKKWYQLHTQKN